jgi:hypothetical protein
MKSKCIRDLRRNRGSVTVFFTLGMICMIGIAGVTIDFGHVAARKTMLQNYVDAKAVATLKEEFGSPTQRIELKDYLGDGFVNALADPGLKADVAPGVWNFTAVSNKWIAPAPFSLSASMVPARSATVAQLDVPLFFGPLFGIQTAKIHADAIAFAPKREVVIVQDVSGSMNGTPRTQAANANWTLVNQMQSHDMPGDRVGVVAFDSAVVGTLNLTNLNGGSTQVLNWIQTNLGTGGVGGGGTNIPSGIQAGTDMFTATGAAVPSVERIMIVVGDGGDGNLSTSQGLAATAGNDTNRINLFTIYFATGGNNCGASGATYLQSLPQRRGNFSCAPNGSQLTQIMTDIVTGVPMRLVQ